MHKKLRYQSSVEQDIYDPIKNESYQESGILLYEMQTSQNPTKLLLF